MSWLAWLVLLLSVAGNLVMIPPSAYKNAVNAVFTTTDPHPMPIVIPRSRITSKYMKYIPGDAAIVCDRSMEKCITHHIPGWISETKTKCDAEKNCTAEVIFDQRWIDPLPFVIVCSLGSPCLVILCIVVLVNGLPLFGDWVATEIWEQERNYTVTSYFTKRMLMAQRYILFCKATGYWKDSEWKSPYAAYADATTMATFTPEDGFRLRFLEDGAPELPAWRFRKVTRPSAPERIRKEWAEAVKMRDTIGVRIDVGAGIGIEWRQDGGMRVWCWYQAYDSYIPEPVSAPQTE